MVFISWKFCVRLQYVFIQPMKDTEGVYGHWCDYMLLFLIASNWNHKWSYLSDKQRCESIRILQALLQFTKKKAAKFRFTILVSKHDQQRLKELCVLLPHTLYASRRSGECSQRRSCLFPSCRLERPPPSSCSCIPAGAGRQGHGYHGDSQT